MLQQFLLRVKHTLEHTFVDYIDMVTESVPERIMMVIRAKRSQIKH